MNGKYDETSEAFNLCEVCGFSWCECGIDRGKKVEKHAELDNISRTFPFTELIPDEEVKREMETQISEQHPSYHIIEWEAHDVPMGFGRRIITCKFEVVE